jgi:hypothetical protein
VLTGTHTAWGDPIDSLNRLGITRCSIACGESMAPCEGTLAAAFSD